MSKIPVIDLFAGPGGLGEGFSSLLNIDHERVFDIKLSIEVDEHAHKTLRLRSFYRQFKQHEVPEIYYNYIRENDLKKKDVIIKQIKEEYSEEWKHAEQEAWKYELPFKEETSKDSKQKKGYTLREIVEKHKEIDERINKSLEGEKEWLLIGGPPCQAYSLVGRSRNKGINEEDHRVFLYKEYLRIIAKHHPAVFVMENVKGLLSAKVGEQKIFDWIKKDLKNPGTVFKKLRSPKYKVYSFIKKPDAYDNKGFPIYKNDSDYLIKSEKYGIPQRRHRVILLGIREDVVFRTVNTLKTTVKVKLKDVIDSLPPLRSGIGREIIGENEKGNHIYSKIENKQRNWEKAVNNSRAKLRKLFPEPDESKLFSYPVTQGNNFVACLLSENLNPLYENWYKDERLKGILNHETRTHLREDLCRYLFSALYLEKNGDFPKLKNYPEWLRKIKYCLFE